MKINSDDLDKYLSVLEQNSFDFDLKEYEIIESNFFRYGGNFHDTVITDEKMNLFLEKTSSYFKILSKNYISKLNELNN